LRKRGYNTCQRHAYAHFDQRAIKVHSRLFYVRTDGHYISITGPLSPENLWLWGYDQVDAAVDYIVAEYAKDHPAPPRPQLSEEEKEALRQLLLSA
jgi:hypothetical protein